MRPMNGSPYLVLLARRTTPVLFATLLLGTVGCPESDELLVANDALFGPLDAWIGPDFSSKSDAKKPPDTPGGDDVPPGKCSGDSDCPTPSDIATCRAMGCDQSTGKCVEKAAQDGAQCDDDNACTVTLCKAGVCAVMENLNCDDGKPCTSDVCDKTAGCKSVPQTGTPCDDGDPTTLGDVCQEGVCKPGQQLGPLGSDTNPAKGCAEILAGKASTGSKAYWLKNAAGQAYQAFCDMESFGGGWTRVANVRSDTGVCAYAPGMGTAADVITDGASSGILTLAGVAEAIPFTDRQVMVVLRSADGKSTGTYLFRSTNAGFTWSAIAQGTVNASNVATYAVECSRTNGSTWEKLKNLTGGYAKCLLGGDFDGTNYSVLLGHGATKSGTFAQDAKCASSGTAVGLYSGVLGGHFWNTRGWIYIR